jgi:site-specific DNA-methyltransferase (adenine-specific)
MTKMAEKGLKFDAIITDPPYGTTACKWDTIIPFDKMWSCLNNLIKENTPIVLFGSQPFTSELIHSNIRMFKYEWIWNKNKGSNIMLAKKQPLKIHENILVFGGNTYFPQKTKVEGKVRDQRKEKPKRNRDDGAVSPKGFIKYAEDYDPSFKFPVSIQYFTNHREKTEVLHPTQKPIKLMEYLINTYTKEGDLILDFTCGSGTTLVASKKLNRKCYGIELEEKYCEITKNRLIEIDNITQ